MLFPVAGVLTTDLRYAGPVICLGRWAGPQHKRRHPQSQFREGCKNQPTCGRPFAAPAPRLSNWHAARTSRLGRCKDAVGAEGCVSHPDSCNPAESS